MRNMKRVAVCVIALMLVCQIAFAAVDISGAWVGSMQIASFKIPLIYGVIDGKDSGNLRFVVPDLGTKSGIKGTFRWRSDLPTKEGLYMTLSVLGKTGTMYFAEGNVTLGKNKLTMKSTFPDIGIESLKNKPIVFSLKAQLPGVKKVVLKKAKVGVASDITVKTTDATDYVVLTDAADKVLAINDSLEAKTGVISYDGWIAGKNTLYVYAGLKDGAGNIKISAVVGGTLSTADKNLLSSPKKFTVKAK